MRSHRQTAWSAKQYHAQTNADAISQTGTCLQITVYKQSVFTPKTYISI